MSQSELSLARSHALFNNNVFFAGVYEDWDIYEPATRMFSHREGRDGSPWGHIDFPFHTAKMCTYNFENETYLIVLSSEAEVYFHCMSDQARKPHTEQIPEAGLEIDGARGYGRMMSIRQIGEKLYACGNGGQIYIRDGKDNWRMLIKDLLWDPDGYAKSFEEEVAPEDKDAYNAWHKNISDKQNEINPRHLLQDINGPSETEIYISGEYGLFYVWNGEELENVDVGTQSALTDIHVTDEGIVWVCGRDGQLFSGNEENGFDDHSQDDSSAIFTSVTTYKAKVYIVSHVEPVALIEFDPKSEKYKDVTPKDYGEFEYLSDIQAIDGVMWLTGMQEILRLKDDKWERIEHPDIPAP